MKRKWIGAFCIILSEFSIAATEKADGISSQYSDLLPKILHSWSGQPKEVLPASDVISIEALTTDDNDTYMGFAQQQKINAPVAEVVKIIEDFEKYPELFDGVVSTNLTRISENKLEVKIEQNIPFPFVPNERNVMLYEITRLENGLVHYRYQLKSSKYLKSNDGFIILRPLSKRETLYIELDFWDADWGLGKALGKEKLWRDNLKGLLQADLAIKLRAENPDWTTGKVKKESLRLAESQPVKEWISKRKKAEAFLVSVGVGSL